MTKIKDIIERAPQWSDLRSYIELIDQNRESNPNVALDGAKSLLETIAKTILADRGVTYSPQDSIEKLVKMAARALPSFVVLEQQDQDTVLRIVSSLGSVAGGVGTLRNRHGTIGHGQDLHDGRELDPRLADLAIDGIGVISVFLIEAHTAEPGGLKRIQYEGFSAFNAKLDEERGLIEVAGIQISPSRALFDQDIEAYKEAALAFGDQKENLITALEESGTFANTHQVIAQLAKQRDFSDEQVVRMVDAAIENTQISWIAEDEDVKKFYTELLQNRMHILSPEAQDQFRIMFLAEEEFDPSQLSPEEQAELLYGDQQ